MKIAFYLILLFSSFSCKEGISLEEESSQLFFNGDIITMENDSIQYSEVIVAQNGKLVFVGKKV